MAIRRSLKKPYKIRLNNIDEPHKLAAAWFFDFVRRGLIVIEAGSSRIAVPREGVIGWLEEGQIRLLDTRAGVLTWIRWRLNCQTIERQAIYRTDGANLTPYQLQQEIQRQYCLRI